MVPSPAGRQENIPFSGFSPAGLENHLKPKGGHGFPPRRAAGGYCIKVFCNPAGLENQLKPKGNHGFPTRRAAGGYSIKYLYSPAGLENYLKPKGESLF